MPNELTAEELVELYDNPNSAPLSGRFVGPEPRYDQVPYGLPSREEVAKAVETARNYQYTQDIPGVNIRQPLPHERVLGAYFGGFDNTGGKEGAEAAMLFRPDRVGPYSPSLDSIYSYSKLPYRTQEYTEDLSPALRARIRQEQALRDAEVQKMGQSELFAGREYQDMRIARTAPLREAALKELEAMYPGLTDIKSVITGNATRIIVPSRDYDSDAAMKQEVIDQIERLATNHIRGFESGNPKFYTQRPGYAGETLLDEARRTLNYFRKMYPEDAQSARLLGRYINQVEAKYPMMQGATEYPTRADLPKE